MKCSLISLFLLLSGLAGYTQRVDLRPPDGTYQYKFSSVEKTSASPLRCEVYFRLLADNEKYFIIIDSIFTSGQKEGPLVKMMVDDSCRASFGGNAQYLGRFRIGTFKSVTQVIPRCINEQAFGGITDIITFIQIPLTNQFGSDHIALGHPKTEHGGFQESWKYPPDLIQARIQAEGGTLVRAASSGDKGAILDWTPAPMHLEMLRSVKGSNNKMLIAGNEYLVLRMQFDKKGVLQHAVSTRDDLDMQFWLNEHWNDIPAKAVYTTTKPSGTVKIARELSIRLIH